MPFKVFNQGDEATAADVNNYLMKQAVATFPTAAARTTAIPSPTTGMVTARDDRLGVPEVWNGTAWLPLIANEVGFNKSIGSSVALNGSANSALAIPGSQVAWGTAVLIDATAKVTTASASYSNTVTLSCDVSGTSPAFYVQYPGDAVIASGLATFNVRCLVLFQTVAKGTAVTANFKLANAGGAGSGAVTWASLWGTVRMPGGVSSF